MNRLTTLWGREPAMVLALAEAVLALALAFGLNLSDEQFAAIITVASIALGVLTRSQVTPVYKLDR